MTRKTHGGPGRNQGRKKTGEDRGGLVPIFVKVYRDQKEWLASQPNQQEAVRDAIDKKIKEQK